MPDGLLIICAITLPLAGLLLIGGGRLARRETPLPMPIRTPGDGIVQGEAARLAVTHRIGRSARVLGAGLLALTAVLIAQDWRAGRIGAAAAARP